MLRLSICIATFKRADIIAETLESILPQLTPAVEVVVLDGASPDNTQEVVESFTSRSSSIRYIRELCNSGVDADFDKAVGYSRGTYCWLFSDDDILAPGAIDAVLVELNRSDPDLLVVDAEVRDRDLDVLFESKRFSFSGRRTYSLGEANAVLEDLGNAMSFIGCTIVRRAMWIQRNREDYYGTLFIHVGVVFQSPLIRVTALGMPLVRIRIGNAMWTARGFQIWMFLWPDLIWSFSGFSDAAKKSVVERNPWRQPQKLLVWRAYGVYGRDEFKTYLSSRVSWSSAVWMWLIALSPGRAAHVIVVMLLTIRGHARASSVYQLIEGSRYSNRVSRWIAARAGYGRLAHARSA